jgi:hypothetical protein
MWHGGCGVWCAMSCGVWRAASGARRAAHVCTCSSRTTLWRSSARCSPVSTPALVAFSTAAALSASCTTRRTHSACRVDVYGDPQRQLTRAPASSEAPPPPPPPPAAFSYRHKHKHHQHQHHQPCWPVGSSSIWCVPPSPRAAPSSLRSLPAPPAPRPSRSPPPRSPCPPPVQRAAAHAAPWSRSPPLPPPRSPRPPLLPPPECSRPPTWPAPHAPPHWPRAASPPPAGHCAGSRRTHARVRPQRPLRAARLLAPSPRAGGHCAARRRPRPWRGCAPAARTLRARR